MRKTPTILSRYIPRLTYVGLGRLTNLYKITTSSSDHLFIYYFWPMGITAGKRKSIRPPKTK